jgi:hypothetical protein
VYVIGTETRIIRTVSFEYHRLLNGFLEVQIMLTRILLIALFLAAVMLTGCEKKAPTVGEQLDKAATDAQKTAEPAAADAQKTADQAAADAKVAADKAAADAKVAADKAAADAQKTVDAAAKQLPK